MTTIVDWVMTLGFPGKKGVWKKNIMARFFRRKVMAFPTFFSAMEDSGTGPSRDRDEIVLLNNWTSGKGNLVGFKPERN